MYKRVKKPKGVGIYELAFMDRPADPVKGNALYMAKMSKLPSSQW
jgi:cytochrome c